MKNIPVWDESENGGRCVSFETAPPLPPPKPPLLQKASNSDQRSSLE